jgi:tetrahydrodipicolinate N-succinyltransferase
MEAPKWREPIKVGDIVLIGNSAVRIVGIHLGGMGVKNTLTLRTFGTQPKFATPVPEQDLIVPEELVLLTGVYRQLTIA